MMQDVHMKLNLGLPWGEFNKKKEETS